MEGIWKLARILNPAIMSEEMKLKILASPQVLNKEIDKAIDNKTACDKAKKLLYTANIAEDYLKTHPSSIGTDIYNNKEEKCGVWMEEYIKWCADRTTIKAPIFQETGMDIPMIKMPEMPKIKIPDLGGVKRSLQVSAIVLIGVILVIVYMLTGKGEKGI